MRLYILRAIESNNDQEQGPWNPWYDKYFGFVIRAKNPNSARKLAHSNAGDEKFFGDDSVWLNKNYTSCKELKSEGEEDLIIEDFRGA